MDYCIIIVSNIAFGVILRVNTVVYAAFSHGNSYTFLQEGFKALIVLSASRWGC